MTPTLDIRVGDCRELLRAMPDESVQCCVTSPPYFGLRDYGTADWKGGDPGCDHRATELRRGVNLAKSAANTRGGAKKIAEAGWIQHRGECPKCGAVRVDGQRAFREVRRVLKSDGTLWLNLGDSYANDGKWGGHTGGKHAKALHCSPIGRNKRYTGLKPKDLIGIPWRVAFGLQADGWFLRSDIIWQKPNPMPESIRDRPTKSHEYLFLLTRSERYFYDADAIAEPVSESMLRQIAEGYEGESLKGFEAAGAQNPSETKRRIIENARKKLTAGKWSAQPDQSSGSRMVENVARARANGGAHDAPFGLTRNKRTVWTVPTVSFDGAHFATYPPALIKPCILAGTKPGDVVLDPFGGSGTTGQVSLELGRSAVLLELNPEYAELARRRCSITPAFAL